MNRKICIIVFLATLSLRIAFCIPVFIDFERATGPGSDAQNYLILAEHLLQKHQFSVYEEETGYREAARTPGYPLYIACADLISGNRGWFVIVLQCILEALLACGIFLVVAGMLGKVLPGVVAATLYGIHPHQALYTSQVLSEILFAFVLFLSIAAIMRFLHNRAKWTVFLAGGLLAVATLVRPIAFFFFLPVVLLIIIAKRKELKRALLLGAGFMVMFFGVLSPWYVRNYLTFDRIMISTIGNWNIGYYNAAMIIAQKQRISLEQAQLQVAEEVKKRNGIADEEYQFASDDPEICGQIASHGFEVIRANPVRYAALHTMGFLHVFVPMEYAFLYKVFGREGIERAREANAISKGILSDTFRGKFISLFRTVVDERFRKFPWWFTTVWFTFSLFQLLVYVFAVRGFAYSWRQQRVLFPLFLLTIIYFAIMPGPVGDPRFRVPVEPLFMLLAGAGITNLRVKAKLKVKSEI